MGASPGGSGGAVNTTLARINVTPFVDVMLVLLVIFMVTTPMMLDDDIGEIEMNLPAVQDDDSRVDIEEVDQLILVIDENLQIYIGDEPIVDCGPYADEEGDNPFEPCFDQLQAKVEDNRRLQEEGRLFLLADTDIPYGVVVGSMNRVRLAGVEQVGMVTNPELRLDDEES